MRRAIPLVDLLAPEAEAVAVLRDACVNHGFFYVMNHGVPAATTARAFAELERFFAQDEEAKLEVLLDENHRGYTPFEHETLDPARQTRGDLKEGYYIGVDKPAGSDVPVHGPNRWPERLPGWRETMEEYFAAQLAVGHRLLPLVAQAADLPASFFEPHFTDPVAILRLLQYAPIQSRPEEGVLAAGAHSDYGMLTLLTTDANPGLQLLPPGASDADADAWVDVEPVEGAIVVNIGDMLARWTNDRFRSTRHRVVNVEGCVRRSMPFFFEPNFDTLVACAPSCQGPENPARYEPVTSGQYLMDKYAQTDAPLS